MDKIIRKNQQIFGNTGPTGVLGKFGSFRAGSPVYSTDLDILQELDAFINGWQYAGLTGNVPAIQDMNTLCHIISRQIAYMYQMGIGEHSYDGSRPWDEFDLISDALGGLYSSIVNNNATGPNDSFSWWKLLHSRKITFVNNVNYTVDKQDHIICYPSFGVTGGNKYIDLPDPGLYAGIGRKITCLVGYNGVLGATSNSPIFRYTGSTGYTIPLTGSYMSVRCDENFWRIDLK